MNGLSIEQLCALANIPDVSIGWPTANIRSDIGYRQHIHNAIDQYLTGISSIPNDSAVFHKASIDWHAANPGKKAAVQMNITNVQLGVSRTFSMADVSEILDAEYSELSRHAYRCFDPAMTYMMMGVVYVDNTIYHSMRLTTGSHAAPGYQPRDTMSNIGNV